MPRKQSHRVHEVQLQLENRLRGKGYQPGDRFLSARELAQEFNISYQTAHRLLDTLCTEGLVERRQASGTYIPGGEEDKGYEAVRLFFDVRARRPGSFGARLLESLGQHLRRDRISWELAWTDQPQEIQKENENSFPVIWQDPKTRSLCRSSGQSALLLNERPEPGLAATFLDSVSIDDYFGGVCAAQYLRQRSESGRHFAVVTGPSDDPRSHERESGFRSTIPDAALFCASGWFREDGLQVAGEAVRWGIDGVFCCNDRLAEAVLSYCSAHHLTCPLLIGFDNAPISETLNLTTVAIPWEEFIADAADIIRQRLSGDTSAARQRLVTPYLVIRGLV
jgi:hypothetical protein